MTPKHHTPSTENTVPKTSKAHGAAGRLTTNGRLPLRFMDNVAKQNAWQGMKLKILQHNQRQADEQGSILDTTRKDRFMT